MVLFMFYTLKTEVQTPSSPFGWQNFFLTQSVREPVNAFISFIRVGKGSESADTRLQTPDSRLQTPAYIPQTLFILYF